MSSMDVIKGLEAQIAGLTASLNETKGARELAAASDTEQRAALEARVKATEDLLSEIQTSLRHVERTSLPGCEPGSEGGKSFSMAKLVHAITTNNWANAGFEKEVCDGAKRKAMESASDSLGGFLVPDEAIPQVIERLKARVVAFQLGARQMPAVGSPMTVTRIKTSAGANWVGSENSTITASDLAFDQIEMSPRTLAARVILSNQLIELGNPSVDRIIEDDMVSELAIGADTGVLRGTGASGQPLGMINSANINTASVSANVTYAELQNFVAALDVDDALRGRLGWALHPQQFTQVATVKSENATAGTASLDVARYAVDQKRPETILGYPFATTTSFAATTGANSMVFANWDDVLVPMWGGVRVSASMDADSAFSMDQTHIRAIMRMDVGLRHPESVCVAS